jgi:hypothetical protein
MAEGSARTVVSVVLLIVGLVLGYLAGARGLLDGLFPPKGVRAIVVGPDPSQLNIPKLKLSKERADVAFWVARNPDDKLFIEFEKQPFADMERQPNGRYLVDCPNRRWCFSREITGPYEDYKYWQVLIGPDGRRREADGRMIIDK